MTTTAENFLTSALNSARFSVEPLVADGSDRRFARVRAASKSYILVENPHNEPENRSYYLIGKHLEQSGLPAPRFIASAEGGLFLMEDLGDTHLQTAVSLDPRSKEALYRQTVEVLVAMQVRATPGFREDYCFDTPRYDRRMAWEREARYFVDAFLKGYLRVEDDLSGLESELEHLAGLVEGREPEVFMHRDFQSRNLMVIRDRVYIIDFQGARFGPPHYDLASLLGDPYVNLEPQLRLRLMDYYMDTRGEPDREQFKRRFFQVGTHRAMQILGAYGFLTGVKNKPFFETHIPAGVKNLAFFVAGLEDVACPELRRTTRDLERRFLTRGFPSTFGGCR